MIIKIKCPVSNALTLLQESSRFTLVLINGVMTMSWEYIPMLLIDAKY